MKDTISSFLEQKKLAENSRLAYLYDLQQFLEVCQDQINPAKLAIYQASIKDAKSSVQKRKISAVNQFLYYLYEKGQLDRFYKLTSELAAQHGQKVFSKEKVDVSLLWQDTDFKNGQLIALLAVNLGLTPSEMMGIRRDDLNLNFEILTLTSQKGKRIIPLPKDLLPYIENQPMGTYLFDKKGQSYSRQWFFNRLSEYVSSLGHGEWTAQFLRDQYIISQLEKGQSVDDLAKLLGLSSRMSLEKYR